MISAAGGSGEATLQMLMNDLDPKAASLAAERVLAPDIETAATLVRGGVFAEIWKS